jgi:hypothetical protein
MALAADPRLQLPAFDQLQQLATRSTNVSIGAWPLGIAAEIIGQDESTDPELRQLLRGLKGIYVRSYEFAADNMYPSADVEAVREQLSATGWSPLAQIRSHRDAERVDVYVCMSHEKITGLAVVASDRRRFTIVNVVGSIDPAKLGKLGERFGVPDLGG